MRNHILHIIKKEFDRFFRDKRMVFTTLLLPGLLIYVMYSLMGAGFARSESVPDAPSCCVVHLPNSFQPIFSSLNFELTETDAPESEKEKIQNKELDLLVVFPADFDAAIAAGSETPNIVVYYNSTSDSSSAAYSMVIAAAEQMESSLANIFDVNKGIENPDLATESDIASYMLASLVPMLIIMMLFSACVSVAPESIAGEKERGTIATLLVTPVSRRDIAIGKIISLSVFALLSGLSSFLGIMLSLPKLLGQDVPGIGMDLYGGQEYVCLLCTIATSVLLIVSMISAISACAKTVKEAATAASPLMIFGSLAGIVPMFSINFSSPAWRLIPIFNSALCLNDIFAFDYTMTNIAITCVSNIIYMVVFVFMLTKMFNSEKIMFQK